MMVEAAAHVQYHEYLHEAGAVRVAYHVIGEGGPLLYLHGWGQNRRAFWPLVDSLGDGYRHILVDFPGFGESSQPPCAWGTEEYAACILDLTEALRLERFSIIGHSFGGRVAVRMAVQAPERLDGMALIASAGLKRRIPLKRRARIRLIQTSARLAGRLLPSPWGERVKQGLFRRIASRDYLQAGELRATFVRVVQEDLAPLLPRVSTPVLLLWGAEDSETPPELGRRMNDALPNSTYLEFDGFDHHSILDRGRHQIGYHIARFLSDR